MKAMTAALIVGLALISTRASAQIKPGSNQASLDLGLANPLSNETDNGDGETFGKLGAAFGAAYLHQLQGNLKVLSVGADFNYKHFGSQDVATGHGPAEIKSSAWTLLAVARGDLMPDNQIRPYGLVGLGIGGARSEWEYQNPRFSNTRTSAGPAFALGGGADYDINSSWLVGAEMRYSVIATDSGDIGTSSVSSLDFLLKAGFKF
jgi:opacity protein-like surface antigen